jgi:hypothetical protein
MPRIFSFEREVYATLDLIPLGVRRKLDLAGVKLSLAGWQALPLADRRALAEAEVGDEASIVAFGTMLREAAGRAGARLDPLPAGPHPWRVAAVPPELGGRVGDEAWAALDDEARHALLLLARGGSAAREERLRVALAELGLTKA